MGKEWKCPRDGAVLDPMNRSRSNPEGWTRFWAETKLGGRWHFTYWCRGPGGGDAPHEVVVTKRGVGVVAACPKVSDKPSNGLSPAPPPAEPPRRTVIVKQRRTP